MFAVLVSVDIATSTNGREKCVAENLHISFFLECGDLEKYFKIENFMTWATLRSLAKDKRV